MSEKVRGDCIGVHNFCDGQIERRSQFPVQREIVSKTKFQTDELDEKLNEAVSEENWQASTELLHQIANASYNYDKQQKVAAFVWDKLKHKSWKKVLKTLHLVDFLIKYGPPDLIEQFKENIYEFRRMDDFSAKTGTSDQGQSIRKQAKAVLVLLTDDHLLQDQRAKAKQIKERMASVIGSGAYFGQFSSDTRTSSDNRGPNYGSISSDSYRPAPIPSKGLTFGETVMRELQEKKAAEKGTRGQEDQLLPQKAPEKPAKLNLTGMNKKDEPQKKSFNTLAMKLTKPPQKKPVGPGSKPSEPKKVNPATQPADILNLDISVPSSSPSPLGLDFLSAEPATAGSSKAPETAFNLFDVQPSVPSQPIAASQPQPFLYQNFSFENYGTRPVQSTAGHPVQGQDPRLVVGIGQKAGQGQGISLNLGSEKKAEVRGESSLIDFSNFRQELGSIKHEEKKETLSANWDW